MRKLFAVAITAVSLFASPALAAPTLTTSGSTVIGVSGLAVGTNTYNVRFTGGTSCDAVFDACEQSNFAFTDATGATAAANALLNVIGTTPTNNLGGCGLSSPGYGCYILIPYAVNGRLFSAADILTYGDGIAGSGGSGSVSSAANAWGTATVYGQQYTFAKFSLVSGAVPEPATWAMMLLGFGAIGFVMRRKRTSALVRA